MRAMFNWAEILSSFWIVVGRYQLKIKYFIAFQMLL